MNFSRHPIWLVGFRPFFALAMLAGASLPILWALVFSGFLALPPAPFAPVQWHAHEMFFGFGWAVLGGFLLTATKNWVQIRGHHGQALIFLAAAWLLERAGMWWAGALPPWLFAVGNNLFLGSSVAMLLWTLLRHRRSDSYRADNLFFLVVLPLFLLAKNLLLDPGHFQAGWTMALGLFRMAFLIMLERTLTQFMKSIFQADILRDIRLDTAIKAAGLVLVFEAFLPAGLAAGMALLLALLLAARFAFWKPRLGMRRIDIGIMYLGYLAIVAQLVLDCLDRLHGPAWVGAMPVHVFTFGAMGLVIPAMLFRICKGHTGRKVVFDPADKAVLGIMILGLALRVAAPQILPGAYAYWIDLAALCWSAGFALLAVRYIPMLLAPRADGKPH